MSVLTDNARRVAHRIEQGHGLGEEMSPRALGQLLADLADAADRQVFTKGELTALLSSLIASGGSSDLLYKLNELKVVAEA